MARATHRKGACCAGQDIHDARRSAERIGIPHYVLDYESRFKEAVIDRFAESYVAGETPVPCVECNQVDQVPRPAGPARELGARRPGDRPLCRGSRCPDGAARSIARARTSATRAISCSPPRASSSTCCVSRSASMHEAGDARAGAPFRSGGRRQARQPGHLLRAVRPLRRRHRAARPGAAEPGDIVDLDGRVLGRHAASSISPSASGAGFFPPPAGGGGAARAARSPMTPPLTPPGGEDAVAPGQACCASERPGPAGGSLWRRPDCLAAAADAAR